MLRELNESLQSSNAIIRSSTEITYHALIKKTTDPATAFRAAVWVPRAQRVLQLTDSITSYLKGLKQHLIDEARFDPFDSTASSPARSAVRHVFIEHKEGQILTEKLAQFIKDVLSVDSVDFAAFKDHLMIDNSTQATTYFSGSLAEAMVMLNKIENEVLIVGIKAISFCNENVSSMSYRHCGFPSALINQSTTTAAQNETITITAGIVYFTTQGKSVITIGGKVVPVNAEGYAEATINAGKIGQHTVPVTIEYTDQDGKKQQLQKTIEYHVKPAQ